MDFESPHKRNKRTLFCVLVYVYFIKYIHAQICLRLNVLVQCRWFAYKNALDRWCVTKSVNCFGVVGAYVNNIFIFVLQFFCCLLKWTLEVSVVFIASFSKRVGNIFSANNFIVLDDSNTRTKKKIEISKMLKWIDKNSCIANCTERSFDMLPAVSPLSVKTVDN